jgi:hypothetical protein
VGRFVSGFAQGPRADPPGVGALAATDRRAVAEVDRTIANGSDGLGAGMIVAAADYAMAAHEAQAAIWLQWRNDG